MQSSLQFQQLNSAANAHGHQGMHTAWVQHASTEVNASSQREAAPGPKRRSFEGQAWSKLCRRLASPAARPGKEAYREAEPTEHL